MYHPTTATVFVFSVFITLQRRTCSFAHLRHIYIHRNMSSSSALHIIDTDTINIDGAAASSAANNMTANDTPLDIISWSKKSASLVSQSRRKLRFHVLGLSHLPVSRRFSACAFTQKIVKLCLMLLNAGHEVILYGAEGSDDDLYTEFVQTHTLRSIRVSFGDKPFKDLDSPDPADMGYDWQKETFRTDFGDAKEATFMYYGTAIAKIGMKRKNDDFLLLTMGTHQKPIADAVRLYLTVEPGIGYYGSYADFRAFESTAAYHYMLKAVSPNDHSFVDGKFYWRTVPNYYDLKEFDVTPEAIAADVDDAVKNSGKYFLFMARLITRKGFHVVLDLCKRLDLPLWICGQGYNKWDPETRMLTLQENNVTVQLTPKMRFLGYADAARRAMLMTHARATMCFTLFTEPFCGVNVESQLCGTPVISTNYGAFVDTIEQGKTGFRCDTTNDIALAVAEVGKLDRDYIKKRARRLYDKNNVQWMFEKYWQDLYDVYLSTVKLPNGQAASRGFGQIRDEVVEYVQRAKKEQGWAGDDNDDSAMSVVVVTESPKIEEVDTEEENDDADESDDA